MIFFSGVKLHYYLDLGVNHESDLRPTHTPIETTVTVGLSSGTTVQPSVEHTLREAALQLEALNEEKKALKHREDLMMEIQRDRESKITLREGQVAQQFRNAQEKQQQAEAFYLDVMEKSTRLEEERAQVREEYRLIEQKAASADNAFVEIMEKKAELEDEDRRLREFKAALSQQHFEVEAKKEALASEEERLFSEKERLHEKSTIEENILTDANVTAQLVDEENLKSEEGCITIEEAEILAQKVSAAAAAKKRQPDEEEAFVSTEVRDVATVEQNDLVALCQTQSTTTIQASSVSPLSKRSRTRKSVRLELRTKKLMRAVQAKGGMPRELVKMTVERIRAEGDEEEEE